MDLERKLKADFGLKNKREIRLAEGLVRKKRQNARTLLALSLEKREQREQELLSSLKRMGLLGSNAALDDVLGLTVPEILERRLQTQVVRRGLSGTLKQARQFITHGHIAVSGRKVSSPSYLVLRSEESGIAFYGKPIQIQAPEPEKKKRGARGSKKETEDASSTDQPAEKMANPLNEADALPNEEEKL